MLRRHKTGALDSFATQRKVMRKRLKFNRGAPLRKEVLKDSGTQLKSGRWCSLNDKLKAERAVSAGNIDKNSLKKTPKIFQMKKPLCKIYG